MKHPCTLAVPPLPSVRALIAQACGIGSQQVGRHDRLVEDLHIDSLEMAGLLVDIENTWGIAIDAAALTHIHTVGQLEAAVHQRTMQGA